MSRGEAEREPGRAEELPLPGGDFRLLVQKLGYQGMIALGLVRNPLTGETTPNASHARALIDDLMLLREKTDGNLDQDERDHLSKWIRDLEHHARTLAEGE